MTECMQPLKINIPRKKFTYEKENEEYKIA